MMISEEMKNQAKNALKELEKVVLHVMKKFIDSYCSITTTNFRIFCLLLICAGIFALIPNGFAADTPSIPAFPGRKVTAQ